MEHFESIKWRPFYLQSRLLSLATCAIYNFQVQLPIFAFWHLQFFFSMARVEGVIVCNTGGHTNQCCMPDVTYSTTTTIPLKERGLCAKLHFFCHTLYLQFKTRHLKVVASQGVVSSYLPPNPSLYCTLLCWCSLGKQQKK